MLSLSFPFIAKSDRWASDHPLPDLRDVSGSWCWWSFGIDDVTTGTLFMFFKLAKERSGCPINTYIKKIIYRVGLLTDPPTKINLFSQGSPSSPYSFLSSLKKNLSPHYSPILHRLATTRAAAMMGGVAMAATTWAWAGAGGPVPSWFGIVVGGSVGGGLMVWFWQ